VSSADEWGAGGLQLAEDHPREPAPPLPARPGKPPLPAPLPPDTGPTVAKGRPDKGRRPPPRAEKAGRSDAPGAGGWRKARGGMGWVLAGLFFLALPGFVPFAKQVYQRSVGELPTGEGWITIEGVVNGKDRDSVKVSKQEEINVLAYGLPVLLGGFAITIGRLTAGAAPRDSGAKGLFAFSGMLTLLSVTGLVTYVVCQKYKFNEMAHYGWYAFALGAVVAEFWFLMALAAANGSLRNPGGVRTVGLVALVMGIGFIVYLDVFHYQVGWNEYAKQTDRPKNPKPDESQVPLWEAAAGMLGWLLLIGVYWRAVRATKSAIQDHLDMPPPPKPQVPVL
jgi:hypothetical protein